MEKIALLVLCLLFVACGPPSGVPVSNIKQADNTDYMVTFLFEKNGVSVFRFYDSGEYRYFTIGDGKFAPQVQTRTVHTGKTTTTETWVDGANQ